MANSNDATSAEQTGTTGPELLERAMEGFQLYESGEYEEARRIFEELCELDPAEAYYRTALGAISLAEDELDLALENFDLALELNPKDAAALVNRGEVFLRLGSIMEAAQDFARAVDLDPENKDPLTMRARLLAAAAIETIEAVQRNAAHTELKK